MSQTTDDIAYMNRVLQLANLAAREGEVPVGAVIVLGGKVIAESYNVKEHLGDATSHAEILAIKQASRTLGNWRLIGAELYTNLEPCIMCAGAIFHARISRVIYGCPDPKFGALGSLYQLHEDMRLNHRLEVTSGILAESSAQMLKSFFKARRSVHNTGPAI